MEEKAKKKKKKTKNMQRSGASYSASVRAKWFSCKLGFVQLILSKASLMFKSNLELALSIIQ